MADIVGTVTNPLSVEIRKYIVEPIKRQFYHLCCFDRHVEFISEEAKKFEDAREGLQLRVTRAVNNAEEILPQVKTWLEKANEIQVKMPGIESEINEAKGSRLAVKSRFLLSKEVRKTAKDMKQLREDCCNFNVISLPAPPPPTTSRPSGSMYESESRKRIEEDIMKTLSAKNVNMIGICGMGGVGKTYMAKRIQNRVKEEGGFDEVVMATVSQQVDMLKIQREIAELLGLKFEVESLSARAHQLRTRLMAKKRILVILDDLWDSLKLEDLGIPYASDAKGCTILLTSRNRDVFNAMNVKEFFEIQILSEIEAWSLFKEEVGTCADDQELLPLALEIAQECQGLPIALVTVGVALKNKRSESIWKNALQQLRSSNPTDIWGFLAKVYNPLKLSYDLLDNEDAQFIFLLCCLFPEDCDIRFKYLISFAWGLGMFGGSRNLEKANDKLRTLVEILKSRFLLLDGFHETCVKTHDIVRDVASFIASKEGLIAPNLSLTKWLPEQSYNNCTWISSLQLEGRTELPMGLVFPNLRLLLIDDFAKGKFQIDDNTLEGKRELNVLFVRDRSLKSLPQTTELLKSLRTLILNTCTSLGTISVVGELVSLEILICEYCHSIEELPVEIGRLNRLKLLEVSWCQKLKTIAPGVISRLVGLEELKMLRSFDKWEAKEDKEGKERKNATLSELESLSNLTCLEIEVEDSTSAAEEIRLSSNLEGYNIKIGASATPDDTNNYKTQMHLVLDREITVANWIHKLLRSTESLCLEGDFSANLVHSEFENLKSFDLKRCSMVKRLVNVTTPIKGGSSGTGAIFPLLEFLWLEELPNLEEICDINGSTPSNSFKNLKGLSLQQLPALKHLWKSPYQNVASLCRNLSVLYIDGCGSLRNLFSLARTNEHCLSRLEELVISDCEMMEQVLLWTDEEENERDIGTGNRRIAIFPKLKCLRLIFLPGLTSFCAGIEGIRFPVLTEMEISFCPQLKSLVSTTSSLGGTEKSSRFINHDQDGNDSSHLCCNAKVVFGSLKKLEINDSDISLYCCH